VRLAAHDLRETYRVVVTGEIARPAQALAASYVTASDARELLTRVRARRLQRLSSCRAERQAAQAARLPPRTLGGLEAADVAAGHTKGWVPPARSRRHRPRAGLQAAFSPRRDRRDLQPPCSGDHQSCGRGRAGMRPTVCLWIGGFSARMGRGRFRHARACSACPRRTDSSRAQSTRSPRQ
jgi:hypothetical protein